MLGTGNLVTPDPGPDTTPLIFTRPLSCGTDSSSESSESLSALMLVREVVAKPEPPRVDGRDDFLFGDLRRGFPGELMSTTLGKDVCREIRGLNEFGGGIIPVVAWDIKGLREDGKSFLDGKVVPFRVLILYVGKGPIVCNIRDISFSLSITGRGIEVGEALHDAYDWVADGGRICN